MRGIRTALALIVIAAALVAVAGLEWPQLQCNREKRIADRLVERLETIASDFQRQDAAGRAAARLERCVAKTPADWQLHFLLGSLHSTAGRNDAALRSYETSLALEERPETYHAISVIQLENGQVDEALANAEKAAIFSAYFADLYAPPLRETLWAKLNERQKRLREQKAQ